MYLLTRSYLCMISLGVLILLPAGCSDITEHVTVYEAGVYVLSNDDHSVVDTLSEVPSPCSILLYSGYIFVASAEGFVYRFDSSDNSLSGTFQVGEPSPNAYNNFIYSPSEGRAYLFGAYGKIIELSLPDCQVTDEFSVCQAPWDMTVSPRVPGVSPGYLWIIDRSDYSLHQITLDQHMQIEETEFEPSMIPRCVAGTEMCDTILVGTSSGLIMYSILNSEYLFTTVLESAGDYTSISTVPDNDTLFVMINSGNIGCYSLDLSGFQPANGLQSGSPLEGSFHITSPANDAHNVLALSYLGDGVSRLTAYSYISDRIERQTDINGFPLDLKVGGTGMIYVLTCK